MGVLAGSPVELMATGPARYRFGDDWKLGLPLLLKTLVIAVSPRPLGRSS